MQATNIIENVVMFTKVLKNSQGVYVYKIRENPDNPLLYGMNWPYGAMAAALSKERALEIAAMRTVAKYSLFSLKSYQLLHRRPEDLKNSIGPRYFIQMTNPEWLRSNSITKDCTYGWVKASNITSKESAYIPTQYIYPVYFSYITYKTDLDEPYLINQRCIINGRGSGLSTTTATLEALYEAIETDAVISLYTSGACPPIIDLRHITGKENRKLLNIIQKDTIDVLIFAISGDIAVPVFMTVLHSRSPDDPVLSMGFGANLNTELAIQHSLEHALCRRMQQIADAQIYKERAGYALLKKNHQLGDIKLSTNTRIAIKEWRYISRFFDKELPIQPIPRSKNYTARHAVTTIISLLQKKGFAVWARDVTDPVFKPLGIKVVKVFIPGLQEKLLNDDTTGDGLLQKRKNAYSTSYNSASTHETY